MKNAREFFVDSFKSEKPRFVKVLQAVPDDKKSYRPHDKCSTAGDIVWLVASEWGDACEIVDHGKVNFALKPAPPTIENAVAAFEKNASRSWTTRPGRRTHSS